MVVEDQITMQNRRMEYIDIYRGIGIVLMIMGHIGFGGKFDLWIHAFHMPMFFFISGFLHKNKDSFCELIKKKAKALLIPYLIFGIINYIACSIIYRDWFNIGPLIHLITDNSDGLMISGALWFLTALLWVYIIVFVLEKHIKNIKLKVFFIVLLSLFGMLETRILPFRLPLSLGISFVGVGLYYIGFFIARNMSSKKVKYILNLKKYQIILFGIIVTIFIFLNGYINMRLGIYQNFLLFWTNVIASCIILLNISKQIEIEKNKLIQKIAAILKYIGKNAITYIVLNQLIILIIYKLLEGITVKYIPNIINFISTLAILFIINKIITNTKLKVLLGK